MRYHTILRSDTLIVYDTPTASSNTQAYERTSPCAPFVLSTILRSQVPIPTPTNVPHPAPCLSMILQLRYSRIISRPALPPKHSIVYHYMISPPYLLDIFVSAISPFLLEIFTKLSAAPDPDIETHATKFNTQQK